MPASQPVKKAAKKAAKKAVPQKKVTPAAATPAASASEKPTGIKYADKSAGQPQLNPIFEELKALVIPYAKGTIALRGGSGGQLTLVSEKEVIVDGRKKPEMYFVAVLVQKGYVGFYFMPVYTEEEQKALFAPELLQLLKGKSCFHIKRWDATLKKQIKEALKKGYEVYKEKGWV